MDRPEEQDWRLGSMERLGREFSALEQTRAQKPRRGRPRRRARLMLLGGAGLAMTAAIIVAAIALQKPSRALANPNQAAAAAERAATFAFQTRSELRAVGSAGQVSVASGEVDLAAPSFRVRIHAVSHVSGFERIVFPDVVYVRAIGPRGPRPWLGSHLSPPAVITTREGSSGGLGDPLGLLAVLARTTHAQRLGVEHIDGELSREYRLQLTLGDFLAADGQPIPAATASTPVTVKVWQDSANRLLRAERVFELAARGGERLVVLTAFNRYGQPTAISAPAGVPVVGSQRLSPLADDPLGASLLNAITFGTEHTTTAVPNHSQQRGAFRGATSPHAGGPGTAP